MPTPHPLLPNAWRAKSSHADQRGVALIVVLIFIVALTSLAIYSSRDVSLGERLARNQLDAQVAREAAEAALRDAEFDLMLFRNDTVRPGAFCARTGERPAKDASAAFNATCDKGQCAFPLTSYQAANFSTANSTTVVNIEPWWPDGKGGLWNDDLTTKPTALNTNCTFTGGVPYGTYSGRPALVGVSRQPEYLVELIDGASKKSAYVRITARGFGRSPNTEIVLQSYFRPFQ